LVVLRPVAVARRAVFIGGGGVAFLVGSGGVSGVSNQLTYVTMLDQRWFYRQ